MSVVDSGTLTPVTSGPIRCFSSQETICYLMFSGADEITNAIGGGGFVIVDFPTIRRLTGNEYKVLPDKYDCRGKFPYSVQLDDYIAGRVLLKEITAPYYIDAVDAHFHAEVIVPRGGDILWKLLITGLNLKKVEVTLGGHVIQEVTVDKPVHLLEIDLMGGKGIPLIAVHWSDIRVRTSTFSYLKDSVTVYPYFINLDITERRGLVNATEIAWPEGMFKSGHFCPPTLQA